MVPPPGAPVLSAQFLDVADHVFELLVIPPPGAPVLSAQFLGVVDHVFALLELLSAGPGGYPDCAPSLDLPLYAAASFALPSASPDDVPAATE